MENVEFPNGDRRKSPPVERRNRPPYGLILIILAFGFWAVSKSIFYFTDTIQGIKVSAEIDSANQQQLTKTISELSTKLDLVLGESVIYQKNARAFALSPSADQCAICHLKPNMYLLKSNLRFSEFKEYVRGTKRHIDNSIMPKYDEKSITDNELENMYLILKQ